MKRIMLLLALLLFLSACDGKADPPVETPDSPPLDIDIYADHFTYPAENITAFAVDENGTVYISTVYGDKYDASIGQFVHTINAYGLDGHKIAEHTVNVPGSILSMCAGDGGLYAVLTYSADSKEVKALYRYDFETRDTEFLVNLDRFDDSNYHVKIAYSDGCIYIRDIDPEYVGKKTETWPEDSNSYSHNGNILAMYNIAEASLETVFDQELNNFALTPDGKITLFAHDGTGGYYFAELNPKDMTIGGRNYKRFNTHTIYDIASDGSGVVYSHRALNGTVLKYGSFEENSGSVEMLADSGMNLYDSMVYNNGFTFFQSSGKLERVKNSSYIKETPIRLISVTNYGTNLFTEGYNTDFIELRYDEFALTVLSRDASYDICQVHSRQDFAANIRDKGSFYPLNGVSGVREYIDACFPYIQDAATDQNGDIWMIPIDVRVEGILYNEENCLEAGIRFGGDLTVGGIIENVKSASAYDTENLHYYFDTITFIRNNLTKYLRTNTNLDTLEFRELSSALKDFADEGMEWGRNDGWAPEINSDFLFKIFDFLNINSLLIKRDDLSVAPITGTGAPSSANCIFLCVNPDSNNLENTLDYISALCGNMIKSRNSFMLTDRSLYTDSDYARSIYAFYQNTVIDFSISDEVFADDFDKYLNGQITLDQLIKEAGRKLSMYLGE